MTKDELVALIKDTVLALNACPSEEKKEEVENAEPEKKEEACNTETSEEKKEEVDNACSSIKEEVTNTETEAETKEEVKENVKEEVKEEQPKEEEVEKKEEVIKIEALNSAPAVGTDISGKSAWQNLHGDEFFKYLREHPEVR